MGHPIRLFFVSHAEAIRELLVDVFDAEDAFEVVGQCSSGAQALALVPHTPIDLLLPTQLLPDTSGTELCRTLLPQLPGTRALVLSSTCDVTLLAEALDAGAAGVTTVYLDQAGFDDALLRAARGETVAPADVLRALLRRERERGTGPVASLTPLEREIFELIGQGLRNAEIAERLRLAHGTVRNYVTRLMAKLGVQRRAQVIAMALQAEAMDNPR
ncbi:LuxR C-terminal-related transcriptional regulator [Angustibacter sp. McL0619]|uniref:LuxR C-terminal-related transcriptional regulator n=1 Tax=Angustibacter sp. McL0619 TaxID=3415676 RepID=UPI003CE85B9B